MYEETKGVNPFPESNDNYSISESLY